VKCIFLNNHFLPQNKDEFFLLVAIIASNPSSKTT